MRARRGSTTGPTKCTACRLRVRCWPATGRTRASGRASTSPRGARPRGASSPHCWRPPPPMLETDTSQRDALVNQLLQSATGALELFHVYIGDRLGLYDALATGPLTSSGLAATVGISERYAREWLEEQ